MAERDKSLSKSEQQLANARAYFEKEKSQLAAIEAAIDEKQDEFDKISKEGARQGKLKELLAEKESKLAVLEKEITQQASEIDAKRKDVEVREKSLSAERMEWVSKSDIIKKTLGELSIKKADLQEDVRLSKLQLDAISKEFEERIEQLNSAKEELKGHITHIKNLQESDIAMLEEKEDDLASTVDKLEADRKKSRHARRNPSLAHH